MLVHYINIISLDQTAVLTVPSSSSPPPKTLPKNGSCDTTESVHISGFNNFVLSRSLSVQGHRVHMLPNSSRSSDKDRTAPLEVVLSAARLQLRIFVSLCIKVQRCLLYWV